MCEICSMLTKKTLDRRQWCRSAVFIVNFEHYHKEKQNIGPWNDAKKTFTRGKLSLTVFETAITIVVVWFDLMLEQWTIFNITSLISMKFGHGVTLQISSSLCLDTFSFAYFQTNFCLMPKKSCTSFSNLLFLHT